MAALSSPVKGPGRRITHAVRNLPPLIYSNFVTMYKQNIVGLANTNTEDTPQPKTKRTTFDTSVGIRAVDLHQENSTRSFFGLILPYYSCSVLSVLEVYTHSGLRLKRA